MTAAIRRTASQTLSISVYCDGTGMPANGMRRAYRAGRKASMLRFLVILLPREASRTLAPQNMRKDRERMESNSAPVPKSRKGAAVRGERRKKGMNRWMRTAAAAPAPKRTAQTLMKALAAG